MIRVLLLAVLLLFAELCGNQAAIAAEQSYPGKPIRVVVIFPAGGTADLLARAVGEGLTDKWGQPVVIDNRPGASGNIAAEIVAKAPSDGYTILLGGLTTHGINPSLYRKLPYDAIKDFVPVTIAAATPLVVVVNPSVPAQSIRELIALAKAKPKNLNYASFGNGTSAHLCGVLFNLSAAVDVVHVPYKGSPAAVADLLAGRVQVMFDAIPVVLPHIKAGKLRALAVTSSYRASALPEVPTVIEAGLPGFDVVGWLAFFAPAAVEKEIVRKLGAEIANVLRKPEVHARLTSLGLDPRGDTPEASAAFVHAELNKWAPVVKASGAQID